MNIVPDTLSRANTDDMSGLNLQFVSGINISEILLRSISGVRSIYS